MIVCFSCRTITKNGGPSVCPGCGETRTQTSKLDDFFESMARRLVCFDVLPEDTEEGYNFLFEARRRGIL